MNPKLNLPQAELRLKDDHIWDRLRKKYVQNTPEEWVRQNFVAYLIEHLNYSEGLMMNEHTVVYNEMNKRCDIVYMNSNGEAKVIVECKAPHIELTEDTFYQIARYNQVLQAPILIMTNGMQHFCAKIDGGKLSFLVNIPKREELENLL